MRKCLVAECFERLGRLESVDRLETERADHDRIDTAREVAESCGTC